MRYFGRCLASEMTDTASTYHRILAVSSRGSLRSKLTLRLHVFDEVWTPSFDTELNPVKLEAVDVFEATRRTRSWACDQFERSAGEKRVASICGGGEA